MWDKLMYRMFQGCLMTMLIGMTTLFGVRTVKHIKEEVQGNGRNAK